MQAPEMNPRFSKKKGPFYYFYLKHKHEHPSLTDDQAYQASSEIWQQMTPESRLKYKEISHNIKIGVMDSNITNGNYQHRTSEDKYDVRYASRENHKQILAQNLTRENGLTAKLPFISLKEALETDENDEQNKIDNHVMVVPSEMCLSTFSCQSGEIDHFNFIFKTTYDHIPTGYFSSWKECNAKHKIPLNYGTEDKASFVTEMLRIMAECGNAEFQMPLYCFEEQYFKIQNVFRYLNKHVMSFTMPNLQIIEDLLYSFSFNLNEQYLTMDYCHTMLTNSKNDFQIRACDLHEEHPDMDVCCLRYNLRIIYLFLEASCAILDAPLTRKHRPIRIHSEYTVKQIN